MNLQRPPLTNTALTDLATDLRLACMRISRRIRFESADLIAPHQFSALARLECAPQTPREIAEVERVSAPSMTRTLRGLEELGLVSRTPDPHDGRQVIMSTTPAGMRVLRTTRRKRDQWMAARIKQLSTDDQDALLRAAEILARVAAQ